jgi:hypothetical protein
MQGMQDLDQCWPAQEYGCELKLVIQLMVVIQFTQEVVTKIKKTTQLQEG